MTDVLLVACLVLLGRLGTGAWVLGLGGSLIALRITLDRLGRRADADRQRSALEALRTMRMHDPRGPYR